MITDELRQKTSNTKDLINASGLDQKGKTRWLELMDFALENCNGLTPEQKIQGIAELLLEHTRILAERAVHEHDKMSQDAMEAISKKVGELTKVQQNQQSMMEDLRDNMKTLSQLAEMIRSTNERISNLEKREVEDNKIQDNRINNVFTKTSEDILQIRTDIGTIRDDMKKSQEVFLSRLGEYTEKLTSKDLDQDVKTEDRLTEMAKENRTDRKELRDKLDDLNKKLEEPTTWKGVIVRLFSKNTVVIIVLIVLLTLAFNPHALDSLTSIWRGEKAVTEQVLEKTP